MRRAKTHSGSFVCTQCFVEYELAGESSLKCPECSGLLTSGSLVFRPVSHVNDRDHGGGLS
jgi:hypothetical protein